MRTNQLGRGAADLALGWAVLVGKMWYHSRCGRRDGNVSSRVLDFESDCASAPVWYPRKDTSRDALETFVLAVSVGWLSPSRVHCTTSLYDRRRTARPACRQLHHHPPVVMSLLVRLLVLVALVAVAVQAQNFGDLAAFPEHEPMAAAAAEDVALAQVASTVAVEGQPMPTTRARHARERERERERTSELLADGRSFLLLLLLAGHRSSSSSCCLHLLFSSTAGCSSHRAAPIGAALVAAARDCCFDLTWDWTGIGLGLLFLLFARRRSSVARPDRPSSDSSGEQAAEG